MGVGDQRQAPTALPQGKETQYPLYRKLGLTLAIKYAMRKLRIISSSVAYLQFSHIT